jgi:hypothetical protein
MKQPLQAGQICGACAHFRNDPAYLEKEMPGWSSLGSAWGSTRAEDGICSLRELYLSASQGCERFECRGAATPST